MEAYFQDKSSETKETDCQVKNFLTIDHIMDLTPITLAAALLLLYNTRRSYSLNKNKMKRFKRAREERIKKSLRTIAAFGIIAAIASTSIPLNAVQLKTDVTSGAELENEDHDFENDENEFEDDFESDFGDEFKGDFDEKFGEQEFDEFEDEFDSSELDHHGPEKDELPHDFDQWTEEEKEEFKKKWQEDNPKDFSGQDGDDFKNHHDDEFGEQHDGEADDHFEGDHRDEFEGDFDGDMGDHMVQNWKRMAKQLEHSLEQTEHLIQSLEDSDQDMTKEIERLNDRADRINRLIDRIEKRAAQAEDLREQAKEGDEEAMNKMHALNTLSFAMDIRVNFVMMSDEVWRMRHMMDLFEDEIDTDFDEIRALFDEIEGMRVEARELYDEIAQAFDAFSDDGGDALFAFEEQLFDLNDRMHETFKKFWDMEPGRKIGEAEGKFHKEMFKDRMAEEIEMMTEMLGQIRGFMAAMKDLGIDDEEFNSAVDQLLDLVVKASNLLTDMKAEVAEGNFEIMDLWKDMDRIGKAADAPMSVVAGYFESYPEDYDALSDEMKDVFENVMMDDSHEGEHEGDHHDDFEYMYGEFDENHFGDMEEDELRGLMANFSEDDMERLKKFLDNHDAKRMLKRMLKDFDVYGEGAEELIENYIAVLEAIDVEDSADLPIGLRGLYFRTLETVIATETLDELVSAWREAVAAYQAGETDLSSYEDVLDELLAANEEELVNKFAFRDVAYDGDEWYRDFVFEGRGEYWNGYSGDRAGEFGPADGATCAEVLTMAMASKGIEASGSDSSVAGQWWEAQYATALSNGYEFVSEINDFNSHCNRAMTAKIIAEVHELGEVEYRGVFPDVDASDENAGYMQAVYDAGIITGKGDGRLDGEAGINRAELAKVITVAGDHAEDQEFWHEFDEYEGYEDSEEYKYHMEFDVERDELEDAFEEADIEISDESEEELILR